MQEASALRPQRATLLDYVFMARPAALVPVWIFYFAGFGAAAVAARAPGSTSWTSLFALTPRAVCGAAAMTAVLAGGYVLNQVRDREGDGLNDKLFLLSRGIVPLRAAWVELVVLWVAAAVLSLPLQPAFRWIALGSAALCATYSLPPVRAKARFPIDLVWNGAGFGGLSTAAGWVAGGQPPGAATGMAGCYALAVAGIIASTTIPDVDGDRVTGLRTTAVALGERGASALALALVTAAAVAGALLRDVPGLVGSAVSVPLLARAHTTGARVDRVRANQTAVAVFALATLTRSVYPLALLALAYFGSRAYYRRRFGLSYPGPGTR